MSSKRGVRLGLGIFLSLVVVVVAIGIAVAVVGNDDAAKIRGSAPHYPTEPGMRTLVIAPMGSDTTSPATGPLSGSLVSGTVPLQPMMATVVSDTNCAPDAQGVSHCDNQLRMNDGTMLTVRHNHRMMDTPCLSPGEHILVTG